MTYTDQELNAILERADQAPNGIARWMVDVLVRSREIRFTDTQLERVLATTYRVWGKQPSPGEAPISWTDNGGPDQQFWDGEGDPEKFDA